MDFDTEALKAKLAALKTEHRDLDEVIARLGARAPVDQLELQRLKKRKLLLKDQITKIESELLPDIIAWLSAPVHKACAAATGGSSPPGCAARNRPFAYCA